MRLALALSLLPFSAVAQDLPFEPQRIEACLANGGGTDCIGLAADHCTSTPDGYTTVGTGICFGMEHEWWDARLNAVYGQLMSRERDIDAEMVEIGATVPSRVEALRAMQRAWIPFRDAACGYEYSTWGGGSGGGPAHAACMMQLTAEQTLKLETWARDY